MKKIKTAYAVAPTKMKKRSIKVAYTVAPKVKAKKS